MLLDRHVGGGHAPSHAGILMADTLASPTAHLGSPVDKSDGRSHPGLTDFVLLPLLYYVSARIGVVLSVMPEGMAILWPPNGVLLAYFIRFGPRSYLAFGVLAIIAEVAVDVPKYPVSDALLFGLINVAEAAIASQLLMRAKFNPRFSQVGDLAKFVIAAPVTGAFIGAIFGALVYSSMPGAETVYLQYLRIWWFGDALGLMIVTPLLLTIWAGRSHLVHGVPKFRVSDAAIALGAVGMLALLLAARDGTLVGVHVGPVLLLPFAIAAGVRFGPTPAVCVVSAITVFILLLTTQGRNPFGREAPEDAVIHAQEFIFVLSVMTLGLAALSTRVRLSQAELERANAELRRRAEALFETNREMELAKAEVVALNDALEQRVRDRTRELQEALTHVKELRGLLPICAWCKRVRDDHDYWYSVEEYISERTDAQFSHVICPDCLKEVEPRPR
jgi:integral membrane sensor domain MASE1